MIQGRALFLLASILISASTSLAQDIEAGAQVYEENCSTCHGERLRPTGAAPDLKQLGADQRDRFDLVVQEGKGQMPSWAGVLSDDDRAAIWAYIRSRAN